VKEPLELVSGSDEEKAFSDEYRLEYPLPYASLADILDHIDHIVSLAGIQAVGLGSDFDGVGDSLPVGMKSVADYPNLVRGLIDRGYEENQIGLILGGNLMRVWKEVEDTALALQGMP
jgi:membrane dipeptidase